MLGRSLWMFNFLCIECTSLFFPGCHMISTVSVHQPVAVQQRQGLPTQPSRRLLNLQFLDLTDCVSLEDSGLKMIVENCPQLLYLFMRRCTNITGEFWESFYCTVLIVKSDKRGFLHGEGGRLGPLSKYEWQGTIQMSLFCVQDEEKVFSSKCL